MEITQTQRDDVTILSLKGRLDSNTSEAFEKKLLGTVEAGQVRLILDFKELDYISSAGLRVLLKAAKELKQRNGQVSLCCIKDYVREVFEMSGFISFLPIHPSLEESLKTY